MCYNKRTLTLEQAVTEIIDNLVSLGKPFSAHEVTVAVRNEVNRGDLEISGVPFGFVDSSNPHSQQITHADVRSIVQQIADSKTLTVDYSNGYRVYSAPTTVAAVSVQTSPSFSAATPAAPASIPAPASNTPTVPVRFATSVDDDNKKKLTAATRRYLNNGWSPTLRAIQKNSGVRGVTVEDIQQVLTAEGFQVDTSASARSLYTVTK